MKKSIYKLDNVDCANCAAKIEDRLNKLDGMNNATLNFLQLKLSMIYDEEILSEEVIDKTIYKSMSGVTIVSKKNYEVDPEEVVEKPKEFKKIKFDLFRKRNN